MTIESCLAFCTPAGYNFAGVEFSRVLYTFNTALFGANNVGGFLGVLYVRKWSQSRSLLLKLVSSDCDNDIEAPGTAINNTNCNMPCAGNSAEFCGGSGAINIFKK